MRTRVRILIALLALLLVQQGWSQSLSAASIATQVTTSSGTASAPPLKIVASIEPLSMLVRQVLAPQIESGQVTVATLLLPGQTPHLTSFTPGQAQRVQQADLVVWLGAEAEPTLAALVQKGHGARVSLLDLDGLVLRYGAGHDHGAELEGNDMRGSRAEANTHNHRDTELDPHLWLSPNNMARLARALAQQGKRLGLDSADTDAALAAFDQTLAQTLKTGRTRLWPYAQQAWISQHNPWLYFSEAVSLSRGMQVSSGLQSGTSARRFAELMGEMTSKSVACVMAEPEARRALLVRLCRHDDCRIVEADPLGRDVQGARYTDFLSHLTQQFAQCFGEEEETP